MFDVFSMKQISKLFKAPICLYDEGGSYVTCFLQENTFPTMERQEFRGVKKSKPHIVIRKNGVVGCIMWLKEYKQYMGVGPLRTVGFVDEESHKYPYCEQGDFLSVICLLWKMISGSEIKVSELLEENLSLEHCIQERITNDIFLFQEEGKPHYAYARELRHMDSIRRGDMEALKESIEELRGGKGGALANDTLRHYKNLAICIIFASSRSAIEGGVIPELAFSMCESFIHNVEENIADPLKVEKAVREAQYEFTLQVQRMKHNQGDSDLINQVRDYVFCHIHETILVQEIAKYVGVTPNYLSEQFRKVTGNSLKQYIIEEKLVNSESLLKYTEYSLQEISSFFAFSSQSRFCEYFQRKNGITPAKYRKKYKKRRN